MISYVKGELTEVLENSIIIECGGIGIEINVPSSVFHELPDTGEEVKIHTYFKVSEDSMSLYGFNSGRDLEIFKQLIGVSGIGPKGALAILSTLTPDDLRLAIMTGDETAISKAPGIGAKTARRIIVDLKDKIGAGEIPGSGNANTRMISSGVKEEAVEALMTLGYSASEAAKCIRSIDIPENAGIEDIIKLALRKL